MNRLNLKELDQQLINCTKNSKNNPSISYDQLYDIAKSIIAIDFNQHASFNQPKQSNNENDELETTLIKILQLCQTIIDFLLSDIKRLQLKQNKFSNHFNLINENNKLRKLLHLQQKAIIYRRTDILQAISTSNVSSIKNEPDDESTSIMNNSFDQLSSDNCTNKTDSTIIVTKIQCIYCSKLFNDSQAYTKHLQLRHLNFNNDNLNHTSNNDSISLDDQSLSLQTSITSNLSFVQRILKQHCCLKQYQQELYSSPLSKSSADEEPATITSDKIQKLVAEIEKMKNKLMKTEAKLNEELTTRDMLVNDLKNNFKQQIQTIQAKFENKIQTLQSMYDDQRNRIKLAQSHVIQIDDKQMMVDNQQVIKKSTNESIEPAVNDIKHENTATIDDSDINDDNKNQLKQNLRMELKTQLTAKRESRKKAIINERINDENNNYQINNKKTDHSIDKSDSSQIIQEQTKADIQNSIESRINCYLNKNDNENKNDDNASDNNKNEQFDVAMKRINDDRNLLIQQSRYDYDFVKIESSIRNMIDVKLKDKMDQEENKHSIDNPDLIDSKNGNSKNEIEIIEINSQIKDSSNKSSNSNDGSKVSSKTDDNSKQLKSILKMPGNRVQKNTKGNIRFNNEVIEFEISPLNSDNEDDEDVDDNLDMNDMDSNWMQSNDSVDENHIQSTITITDDDNNNENDEKQKLPDIPSISSSTNSSTSSSDDEQNDDGHSNIMNTIPNEPSSLHGNRQLIEVDVHDVNGRSSISSSATINSMPIPAKRKTIQNQSHSTSDNDDKINNTNGQKLRVSELTELIEKKLQNPIRSNLAQNLDSSSNGKKLPPIGSMISIKSTKSNNENDTIANNYAKRNNILDSYDLYEF